MHACKKKMKIRQYQEMICSANRRDGCLCFKKHEIVNPSFFLSPSRAPAAHSAPIRSAILRPIWPGSPARQPNVTLVPTPEKPQQEHYCLRHRVPDGIFQLTRSSLARISSTSRSFLKLLILLPLDFLSGFGTVAAKLTILTVSPSRFRRMSLLPRLAFVAERPPLLLIALSESLSLPSVLPPRDNPPSYRTDFAFPRRGRSERGVQPSPPAKISSIHSSGLSSPAWSCQDAASVQRYMSWIAPLSRLWDIVIGSIIVS